MAKVKKADSKKLLKSLKNIKDIDIEKLEKVENDIFKDLNINESISLLEAMQTEEEIITQLNIDSLEMKNEITSTLDEVFYVIFEKIDYDTQQIIGSNERMKIIFHKKLDKRSKNGFKITPDKVTVTIKGDRNFDVSNYELLGNGVFEISYAQASLKEIKQVVYYKNKSSHSNILDENIEKQEDIVDSEVSLIEKPSHESKNFFVENVKEVLRDLILYNKPEVTDNNSIQSYWNKQNDFLLGRKTLIDSIVNNEEIDLENVLETFSPFFKIDEMFSKYFIENVNKFRSMIGLKNVNLMNVSEIEQAKLFIDSFKTMLRDAHSIQTNRSVDVFIPQWHIYINTAMTLEALAFKIFETYLTYLIQLKDSEIVKHFLLDKNLMALYSIVHTYSYNQKILISKEDFEKCNDFFEVKYFMHILNLYKIKDMK